MRELQKGQTVTYNGQVESKEEEMILIALNKPALYSSAQQKKGKKNNVIDYLNYPKRIYPIGRLDKDFRRTFTSGLNNWLDSKRKR